jgi:hypothetical protein
MTWSRDLSSGLTNRRSDELASSSPRSSAAMHVWYAAPTRLHDLILSQSTSMLSTLHSFAVALVGVLYEGETKRSTTVLVAGELGCHWCQSLDSVRMGWELTYRGFSVFLLLELNDTGSTRATVRLVLDLSALDLADSGEELDEVLVAG